MKAIVTGANGFVGKAVVLELLNKGYSVLGIDITETSLKHQKYKFLKMSIDNIDDLTIDKFGEFNVFYHFAWAASAGPNRGNEKIQLNHALSSATCLRVAKKLNCDKFIFAGTIMEFETIETIYTDETAPGLSYIYGAGNAVAHMILKPLANSLSIDLIWAYITNTYGPGEMSPRFINTTIRKIHQKSDLEFSAATQNYDFVYISDVANAFVLLGELGQKNVGYVIGSGNARPLKEFIIEIINTLDNQQVPIFGAVPYTGVSLDLSKFSIDRLNKDTGFVPLVSFKEGINQTSKWIKVMDENDQ